MKRFVFCAILLCSITWAESSEKQTLLQANARHGGFVAPAFKLSRLDDARFGMLGYRYGWVVNRSFSLGAAYYDMAYDLTHYKLYAPDVVQPPGNSQYYIVSTHHGGIELEYIFKPDNQMFFSLNALMGIGHIRYAAESGPEVIIDDRHLFIEPTLNINVNISEYVKFIVGFSYHYTSGVRAKGLDDDSLSGFTIVSSIACGIF